MVALSLSQQEAKLLLR